MTGNYHGVNPSKLPEHLPGSWQLRKNRLPHKRLPVCEKLDMFALAIITINRNEKFFFKSLMGKAQIDACSMLANQWTGLTNGSKLQIEQTMVYTKSVKMIGR